MKLLETLEIRVLKRLVVEGSALSAAAVIPKN
jgi:hypothetical protein